MDVDSRIGKIKPMWKYRQPAIYLRATRWHKLWLQRDSRFYRILLSWPLSCGVYGLSLLLCITINKRNGLQCSRRATFKCLSFTAFNRHRYICLEKCLFRN